MTTPADTPVVTVGFDVDLWLYIPESWPWNGFTDEEHWAQTTVRLLAEEHGFDESTSIWLRAVLGGLADGRDENESRFVYLAAPTELVSFVSVFALPTDPETTLRELSGVDDEAATRAPALSEIVSPSLGVGLKTIRYSSTGSPDHDIAAIAQYAWRRNGLDVVVIGSDFDITSFGILEPEFERLALSISVS